MPSVHPSIADARPRAAIAVCGRFHYHNYVAELSRRGSLNRFIYSHKRSDAFFGGFRGAENIWLKEYLVRGYLKAFGDAGSTRVFPWIHSMWERRAMNYLGSLDVLHAMLHGNTNRLIRKAKLQGATILGEVVNAHPATRHAILLAEAQKRALPFPQKIGIQDSRTIIGIQDSDYILAPSEWVKRSLLAEGRKEDSIIVLPFGANTSRFFPDHEPIPTPAKLRVLCVGKLSLRKGQLYLLEAIDLIGWDHIDLTLVGNLDRSMEKCFARWQGKFRHVSSIANDRLVKLYHQSDIFVLPSLEEGMAVVILESLASGLPVLASEASGAQAVVQNGLNGYVLPSVSPESLAAKLQAVLLDRAELTHMRSMCAPSVSDGHTWFDYLESLEKIYSLISQDQLRRCHD